MSTKDNGYRRFHAAALARLGATDDDASALGVSFGTVPEGAALSAVWSEMRQAITEHIEAYLSGEVGAIDHDIARELLIALREIDDGRKSPLLDVEPKRGRRPDTSVMSECKRVAVRYIRLMRAPSAAGLESQDGAPVQSIVDAFRVERNTVNSWMRDPRFATETPSCEINERTLKRARQQMVAMAARYVIEDMPLKAKGRATKR
ncbi:hypothetical protein BLA50215_07030 [Burkholderia lata]|uniref:hypothetical protein n=1 Tax=Burkholderia lata (strain ATCC 17760 / DSM 23089 / LMG 22485 / NCIMB 9086 / R18194 / 383) TaxID=482957 RepID=UPI00145335B5|nr:hypothetical protein [Burkholderia lata]VWD58547.1 hypothetical protein BLA50215_07030 [Burkholderia lata]